MHIPRSKKLCPKIIFEGPRLTGKTDAALALNEHPKLKGRRGYPYIGGLISAEWSGLSESGWGESLITYHPPRRQQALQAYDHWLGLFATLPHYRWIIDRFHISTIVYQKTKYGSCPDFSIIEHKLKSLGFHVALLTRTHDSFEEALAARLRVSANPSQYNDLASIIASTEHFRKTVSLSRLPWKEFDVTNRTSDQIAEEVFDWLESAGAL